MPENGRKDWVPFTFPSIVAGEEEKEEIGLDKSLDEMNFVIDQLDLISTICPSIKDGLETAANTLMTDLYKYCCDFSRGLAETHLFESEEDMQCIMDLYYLDCLIGTLKVFIEDFYFRYVMRDPGDELRIPKSHRGGGRSGKRNSRSRKARPNLPHEAKEILTEWFAEHVLDPYPKQADKEFLSQKTGLPLKQIDNWFINERSRKWHTYANAGGF